MNSNPSSLSTRFNEIRAESTRETTTGPVQLLCSCMVFPIICTSTIY